MDHLGTTAYTELQRAMHAKSARTLVANMSRKEIEGYSIARAVRALLTKDRALAGFEFAVSEELGRLTGRKESTLNSLILPTALLASRDLSAANSAAGGYLVDSELGPVIPALRAHSVVARLGATILPDLVGNCPIPKISTGATTTWLTTEVTPPTESNQVIGLVALTPKTVAGFVEVSRQLLLQSRADVIVAGDLLAGLAAAVDAAAINGSGAGGQPMGLLSATGINAVTGTSLAWSGVLDFVVNAGTAHLDVSGWAMPVAIWKLLANRERFTGAGAILNDGAIDGRPAIHSADVPSATLIGGPWEEIIIGEWGTVELTSDHFTKFSTALVGIRALYTLDVGVRYPAAFSVASSVT